MSDMIDVQTESLSIQRQSFSIPWNNPKGRIEHGCYER